MNNIKMEKVKVSALTGTALDWAVAISKGIPADGIRLPKIKGWALCRKTKDEDGNYDGYITGPDLIFHRKWEAGGPIIERECIRWNKDRGVFYAWIGGHDHIDPLHEPMMDGLHPIKWSAFQYGSTLLIASMRCYVQLKLGDEIEVPEELLC